MMGFTGVRWETRQAERVSRDLSSGAGPKPLFEAGVAWASIASTLAELDSEISQLRKSVVEGWSGSAMPGVLAALESLKTWIVQTGEMARGQAEAAERQAIAHTVAVATMPDAAVIAGVAQLEAALKMVVAPPSALMAGGIARLDEQAVGMKAQASRVMESYEHASTPVAKPAGPPQAPKDLVDHRGAAQARADAEAKMAESNGLALAVAQGAMLAVAGMTGTRGALRASDPYVSQTRRTDLRVDAVAGEEVVTDATSAASAAGPTAPFVPAAGIAQGSNSDASAVAATNYDSVQEVVPSGTTTAAPSVIGVSDRGET